uniref:Peroxiredoxin Q, chloroplastic n=1 Tax=Cucumis melo TaxID=3656 RepID=A0A9I9E9K7_CUCME
MSVARCIRELVGERASHVSNVARKGITRVNAKDEIPKEGKRCKTCRSSTSQLHGAQISHHILPSSLPSSSSSFKFTITSKVNKGQTRSPFTLKDQDGRNVSLSKFKGRPVVVYFYPVDEIPGCTKQNDGTGGLALSANQLVKELITSTAYNIWISCDGSEDIEHLGDIASLDDNVELFLSHDDGDRRDLFGTLKRIPSEHAVENSKGLIMARSIILTLTRTDPTLSALGNFAAIGRKELSLCLQGRDILDINKLVGPFGTKVRATQRYGPNKPPISGVTPAEWLRT